jgi:uncharacterized protein YndB with AHSA1/START domain
MMNTDRIEKKILLHAPLARVWSALVDSTEFGTWFGIRFAGPFVAGASVHGVITPTTIDADVGNAQKTHEGVAFEIHVDKIEPQRLFSFRWHPGAVDPKTDYSKEPMTLVEFSLEETAEGVLLTVVESGFTRIPLERRARAFADNDRGWTMMVKVIGKYVGQKS